LLMLLWIPLRQRPGLGTISNALLVGLAADAALAVLPPPEELLLRSLMLLGAVLLNGIASGMYMGAGLGAGPRVGLLTGRAALAGLPPAEDLVRRSVRVLGAVLLNGIASGMYMGAGLGRGPRDGLMTGLAARTGWSIGLTGTVIELCVLALGWLLGGAVGIGT